MLPSLPFDVFKMIVTDYLECHHYAVLWHVSNSVRDRLKKLDRIVIPVWGGGTRKKTLRGLPLVAGQMEAVRFDSVPLFQFYVERSLDAPNNLRGIRLVGLDDAISNGSIKFLKWAIERKYNEDSSMWTSVCEAEEMTGDRTIGDYLISIDYPCEELGLTSEPFNKAIKHGNLDLLKRLFKKKCYVNALYDSVVHMRHKITLWLTEVHFNECDCKCRKAQKEVVSKHYDL
jgi:hypothetical protein